MFAGVQSLGFDALGRFRWHLVPIKTPLVFKIEFLKLRKQHIIPPPVQNSNFDFRLKSPRKIVRQNSVGLICNERASLKKEKKQRIV